MKKVVGVSLDPEQVEFLKISLYVRLLINNALRSDAISTLGGVEKNVIEITKAVN